DAADLVDVRHARADGLCIVVDIPDEVRGILQVVCDPVQQCPEPEKVKREPAREHSDNEDRQNHQAFHLFTVSRTRPRNRWCCKPSASTASTPSATCGISAALAVFASAARNVFRTSTTRRSMRFTR